jgi:hypothetical protein
MVGIFEIETPRLVCNAGREIAGRLGGPEFACDTVIWHVRLA